MRTIFSSGSLFYWMVLAMAVFHAWPQTVSGVVEEQGTGKKIAGAIVTRLSDELEAVTDSEGRFTIGPVAVERPAKTKSLCKYDFSTLHLFFQGQKEVMVKRYDVGGRLIAPVFSAKLKQGIHPLVPPRSLSPGLYFTEVKIEADRYLFTHTNLGGGATGNASTTPMAKRTAAAAAPDTLHVWADRYLNYSMAMQEGVSNHTVNLTALPTSTSAPMASTRLIILEENGMVAVEAEHFIRTAKIEKRAWYLNAQGHIPAPEPDHDTASAEEAGGKAYIEVLPDTWHKKGDPKLWGENAGRYGGDLAIVEYDIKFTTTGRFYLWTRIRSNDQEDNTLSGGIDNTWPDLSYILQHNVFTGEWDWNDSARFVFQPPKGDGTNKVFYDIKEAGLHTIMFSMREDGAEFDRFFLTKQAGYEHPGSGVGPKASRPARGVLPSSF